MSELSRSAAKTLVRLLLGGSLLWDVAACAPVGASRGGELRVEVQMWTEPSGAAVYAIPSYLYTTAVLADTAILQRYRVGSTNSSVILRELDYVIVFELGQQREVLYNVQVVSGLPNRVGTRFRTPAGR